MSNLKEHVQHIVNTLENGITYEDAGMEIDAEANGYQLDDIISGFDYLTDLLDIEYILGNEKQYLGARILVAFGGPNIWINTRTQQVEGYWWGESCIMGYSSDAMDVDAAAEDLFSNW